LDEANRLLRSRWTDFERNATVRSLVGDIHMMVGRYEEASDAYREAALLAPDDLQRQLQLGLALSRAGRSREAIAVLGPVVARDDAAPWSARLALGRMHLNCGEASAARDVFRKATEVVSNEPDAWAWLARAALSSGDLMTARRAAEKACLLASADASHWLLLGYVARAQLDHDRARDALTNALQLTPSDPLAHCILGQTLESSGRKADAVSHYRQALDADPTYTWAKRLLAAAGT
jgi:tetratricopeptide (TPR) repeat protein